MNAARTLKAKTMPPRAALEPEGAIAARPRAQHEEILALQRAAGNRAVNDVLQGGYEITLTIGSSRIKFVAATKDEALSSLKIAKQRLFLEVRDGLESQQQMRKVEEENAFAASVVSGFGRRRSDDVSIWNPALAALERSNGALAGLQVEFSEQRFAEIVALLQQAADAISDAKRKLHNLREGSIEGAQNIVTGLEVAKVAGGIAVGVLTAGSGTAMATAAAVGYGAAQQVGEQGSKVYHGLAREIDWEGIVVDALISAGIGKLTTGVNRFAGGNVIPNAELEKNIKAFAIKAAKDLLSTQTVKDVIIGKLLSMAQLIIKAGYDTARGRTGGNGLKEALREQFSALLFDEKGDVAFQRVFFQTLGEAIGSGTSRAAVVPRSPHPHQGITEAKTPTAAVTPEPPTASKPSLAEAHSKATTTETKVATISERPAKAATVAGAEILPSAEQTPGVGTQSSPQSLAPPGKQAAVPGPGASSHSPTSQEGRTPPSSVKKRIVHALTELEKLEALKAKLQQEGRSLEPGQTTRAHDAVDLALRRAVASGRPGLVAKAKELLDRLDKVTQGIPHSAADQAKLKALASIPDQAAEEFLASQSPQGTASAPGKRLTQKIVREGENVPVDVRLAKYKSARTLSSPEQEAAHLACGALLRELSGYEYSEALAWTTDKSKNAEIDAHWKAVAQDWARKGITEKRLGEIHSLLCASIDKAKSLSPPEKGALQFALDHELFGSRIWTQHTTIDISKSYPKLRKAAK